MKKISIVLAAILIAGVAQAGVIYDIQTGVYVEGDTVLVTGATVVGVTSSGAFITELPVGPYSGIWVYAGSDQTMLPGDIVDIEGVYEEYFDLSEINAGGGTYVVTGSGPVPTPVDLTLDELLVDPEVYESVAICIVENFLVEVAPTEGAPDYGEWIGVALDTGAQMRFDNFWFEPPTVDDVPFCFTQACGVLNYSYDEFKLAAFVDGIEFVDCEVVGTSAASLSDIKAMFE